ncbi:DUF1349 domain-containing protein [Streptomyces sp. NBC_00057]|uniref:DUF1349 domain-containing protein n=1 Tax=Streptomyces sp. NBC_00057 TaxID=2975634 RepID=UPI003867E589
MPGTDDLVRLSDLSARHIAQGLDTAHNPYPHQALIYADAVRTSRDGDAVTIRARRDNDPWPMVRLAPLAPEAEASAGPFCCSPLREGLKVRFTGFCQGPADASLHDPTES